jgi:hypothetical protein
MRPTTLNLALLGALALGGAAAFTLQPPRVAFDPSNDLDAICSVENPFSAEPLQGEAKHRFAVAVPRDNPLPGRDEAPVYALAKGDVIQLNVSSPRAGGVAIHGILQTHSVRVGDVVSIKVRAKYGGRFPLHFHGDDGSHFEIAVFEIR